MKFNSKKEHKLATLKSKHKITQLFTCLHRKLIWMRTCTKEYNPTKLIQSMYFSLSACLDDTGSSLISFRYSHFLNR